MVKAVLFDLDGTLLDSAPDLVHAANLQRAKKGWDLLPFETLRPFASQGARGLLKGALNLSPTDPEFESAKQSFLSDYDACKTERTCFFAGIDELLKALDQRQMPWGIMTNKVTALAAPICQHYGLLERARTCVYGDSTPESKPSPVPLLFAAEQMGVQANDCVYVGDDGRDMVAGKAAGMKTIACAYGYTLTATTARDYHPDALANRPDQLLDLILWL